MNNVAAKRVVSFLSSATEILYELKLDNLLFGVTHQCIFPDTAKSKPKVITSIINSDGMSSNEIDQKITQFMKLGKNLFNLDSSLLKKLSPDLIITQETCDVCSPYKGEVEQALEILSYKPSVLKLNPNTLDEILESILEIASRLGNLKLAEQLKNSLLQRIKTIKDLNVQRKKVICIEWVDPLYVAGHWIPELIEIAGGINGLSIKGQRSYKISFSEIMDFNPDVVLFMPCGFNLERTLRESERLICHSDWKSLSAYSNNEIYALNALSYFSRPSPRVVTGLEIIYKIINPKPSSIQVPKDSYKRLQL
jgi:iron complex transport system substrate-binding protein